MGSGMAWSEKNKRTDQVEKGREMTRRKRCREEQEQEDEEEEEYTDPGQGARPDTSQTKKQQQEETRRDETATCTDRRPSDRVDEQLLGRHARHQLGGRRRPRQGSGRLLLVLLLLGSRDGDRQGQAGCRGRGGRRGDRRIRQHRVAALVDARIGAHRSASHRTNSLGKRVLVRQQAAVRRRPREQPDGPDGSDRRLGCHGRRLQAAEPPDVGHRHGALRTRRAELATELAELPAQLAELPAELPAAGLARPTHQPHLERRLAVLLDQLDDAVVVGVVGVVVGVVAVTATGGGAGVGPKRDRCKRRPAGRPAVVGPQGARGGGGRGGGGGGGCNHKCVSGHE
ncbi:hypothetical protein BC831DRAFT_452447 [Entophlyctis helioformis]|nr:hypothetical protein BC831DRAFT_452447 [Entophlyctis helioformis]